VKESRENFKSNSHPHNSAVKHAIVVEGGAMRSIFSAGVLDCFMDHNYNPFHFCIGVSAGSVNLAAWLANQRGRNYKVITDYSCRPQFISFKKFLFGGHWMDLDWLWNITIKEIRLDLKQFSRQRIPLFITTTKITSGKAEYLRATAENLEKVLKASCSVPVFYRDFLIINRKKMTDGGVADSIPVIRAYNMGAREITVVLSRPKGYRKKPVAAKWFLHAYFSKTPQLAEAMIHRPVSYNAALDFIHDPPSDCRINVLAPPDDFPVGRLTTNKQKLDTGYEMGIKAAEALLS